MKFFNLFFINKKSVIKWLPLILVTLFLAASKNITVQEKNSLSKKKFEIVDQDLKELDKAKLHKVKTRFKYVAFYNADGTLPPKKSLVEKVIFDNRGFRKEHIRYTGTGEVDLRYIFKFDAKGNMLKMETRNGAGIILGGRESKYDKNGNEIERKLTSKKNPGALKTVYFYDKGNNLVEVKNFSNKGEFTTGQVLKYKNGMMVNSISKTAKGETILETFLDYDAVGRLIKEERKSLEGNFVIDYKYDSKGNLIQVDNPQYKRFYYYNEKGDLIEDKMFQSDGVRQFRVAFTYGRKDLRSEEIRYTNDEKPAVYGKYEYEFYK